MPQIHYPKGKNLTERQAFKLGVQIRAVQHGLLVISSIFGGSPAQAAGFQIGDRILELECTEVQSLDEIDKILQRKKNCLSIDLKIARQSEKSQEILARRVYREGDFMTALTKSESNFALHDITNTVELADSDRDSDAMSCASTESRVSSIGFEIKKVRGHQPSHPDFFTNSFGLKKEKPFSGSNAGGEDDSSSQKQSNKESNWLDEVNWSEERKISTDASSNVQNNAYDTRDGAIHSQIQHLCEGSVCMLSTGANKDFLGEILNHKTNQSVECRHLSSLLKQSYEIIDQLREELGSADKLMARTEFASNKLEQFHRKFPNGYQHQSDIVYAHVDGCQQDFVGQLDSEDQMETKVAQPGDNRAVDQNRWPSVAVRLSSPSQAFELALIGSNKQESLSKAIQDAPSGSPIKSEKQYQSCCSSEEFCAPVETDQFCAIERNADNALLKSSIENILCQFEHFIGVHIFDGRNKMWRLALDLTCQMVSLQEEVIAVGQMIRSDFDELEKKFHSAVLRIDHFSRQVTISKEMLSMEYNKSKLAATEEEANNLTCQSQLISEQTQSNSSSVSDLEKAVLETGMALQVQTKELHSVLNKYESQMIDLLAENLSWKKERATNLIKGFHLNCVRYTLENSNSEKLAQSEGLNDCDKSVVQLPNIDRGHSYLGLQRITEGTTLARSLVTELTHALCDLQALKECFQADSSSKWIADAPKVRDFASDQSENCDNEFCSYRHACAKISNAFTHLESCMVSDEITQLRSTLFDFKAAVALKEDEILRLQNQVDELKESRVNRDVKRNSDPTRLEKEIRRLRAALEGNESISRSREQLIRKLRQENDDLRVIISNSNSSKMFPIHENSDEGLSFKVSMQQEILCDLSERLKTAKEQSLVESQEFAALKAGYMEEIKRLETQILELEDQITTFRKDFIEQLQNFCNAEEVSKGSLEGKTEARNERLHRMKSIAEQAIALAGARDEAMRNMQTRMMALESQCAAFQEKNLAIGRGKVLLTQDLKEKTWKMEMEIAEKVQEIGWPGAQLDLTKDGVHPTASTCEVENSAPKISKKEDMTVKVKKVDLRVAPQVEDSEKFDSMKASILDDKVYFI